MNSENQPPQSQSRRKKEEQPKEKVKVSFAIKPEHFEARKGLQSLYERTKLLKLDEFSEINVENTMKKIVTVLKTWQYEFVPKYSYDYFLQRCQALGNHKRLTAYMAKVRRIHKGEEQWENVEAANGGNPATSSNAFNSHLEQDLHVLSGPGVQQAEEDEDEDNLFELMERAERRGDGRREERVEEEQPYAYVPQGYQLAFSQEED